MTERLINWAAAAKQSLEKKKKIDICSYYCQACPHTIQNTQFALVPSIEGGSPSPLVLKTFFIHLCRTDAALGLNRSPKTLNI